MASLQSRACDNELSSGDRCTFGKFGHEMEKSPRREEGCVSASMATTFKDQEQSLHVL